ncbi:YjjG family noncanonical pyrimidine nucleotidase [Flavihumibacter solisilvae]|uniref:Haloacid dehalogenase n=1 Tax=Flavihumibacter solisilvae TaxID=1349421 RepID=A0A0C1L3Y3_9BACT|nr:YjjG family noncanonical pyrimidine nucleotidase [Flavihumibacter solisilvae]KIC94752.1 haloacid dehalogenase [Flavihumibacter solisilvae]
MKKYQYLFFDLDHTLWDFDSNARQSLKQLFSELSLPDRGINDFEKFYTQYIQHNDKLWERYRKGFIRVDDLRWKRMWHTLLDFRIGDEKLARRMSDIFLELLPTRTLLFPHAVELLDYLKAKGFALHLITNGFEATQHSKLENSGLRQYFGQVITSEGSNSIKPQREIFEYAFRLTGAQPHNSLMIGDNIEVDILGAKNAGMDQVYVNHINNSPCVDSTYTVYSLNELKALFEIE